MATGTGSTSGRGLVRFRARTRGADPVDPGVPDLDGLVRLVANVTDAFTTTVFLPDDDGTLRLVAYWSLSDHLVEDCALSVGEGLIGWVADKGEALRVPRFGRDARTLSIYDSDEDIKTFLAVPVRLSGATGVLAIDSKRTYEFSPKTKKILTDFAAEIAARVLEHRARVAVPSRTLALESVRAYTATLAAARSFDELLAHVVALPASVVPHSGLLLAWGRPGAESLEVLRAVGAENVHLEGTRVNEGMSLIGWVQRKGRILYLGDVSARGRRSALVTPGEPRAPVRSFLGVPLFSGGALRGVLALTGGEETAYPRQITELLGVLADGIAASLAAREAEHRWCDHVGEAPAALVRYGRFVADVGAWLEAGRQVEVVAVDPIALKSVNEELGFQRCGSVVDGALSMLARILEPEPVVTCVGTGVWAVARPVPAEAAEGATERIVQHTFRNKRFRVEGHEVSLPVRVASARSVPLARDPEALLAAALDRLAAARRLAPHARPGVRRADGGEPNAT